MAALGPSGLFHSQGVCDRRPRQLLSKHTISPGARRARSAFRGRSPVKVQAATPQQVLHELPLPTGDWTCNIPVLGETLLFTADPAKWSRERMARHGPVFQSHILGKPTVIVGDLVNWQKVLSTDFKHVGQYFTESFAKASGVAVVADKNQHAFQRKAIAHAFEPEAMASYLPFMRGILHRYLDIWAAMPAGVDLRSAGRKLGFEFAAALVLGRELDESTRDRMSEHYAAVMNAFFTIPVDLPFTPFGKAMASRNAIQTWIRDEFLDEAQQYMVTKQIQGRRGIIHSFLDAREPQNAKDALLAQQIMDQIQTTILAGNDTTATGMISLLGLWPQLPQRVKEKLREEQNEVRGKYGDELGAKAMAAMPYALSTVKEIMRILPTAAGIFRVALEDFELAGKLIRKGSSTRPALAVWGMGPHVCQGIPLFYQEAKMLLAILTRSYDVVNLSGPFEWNLLPVVSPKTPVTIAIKAC
ncbi:hypothetical protein WJX84_001083 [Apatococcus fuscideae]|uniref:Cytochrome P450 n=1 Tax=Apatococcus fuscideae TaxID=2026836 RepID=A0AAW1TC65_9CHLO